MKEKLNEITIVLDNQCEMNLDDADAVEVKEETEIVDEEITTTNRNESQVEEDEGIFNEEIVRGVVLNIEQVDVNTTENTTIKSVDQVDSIREDNNNQCEEINDCNNPKTSFSQPQEKEISIVN